MTRVRAVIALAVLLGSCGRTAHAPPDAGASDAGSADAGSSDAGPDSGSAATDAGPRVDFFASSHDNSQILRMQGHGHVESWQVIDSANPGLVNPHGMAIDAQGTLWVSDRGLNTVLAYDGGVAPGASFGTLDTPIGLTLGPDGDVYVNAYAADGIYRSTRAPPLALSAFVAPGAAFLHHPSGLTFGPDGLLYVTDNLSNQIAQVDPTSGQLLTFIGTDAGMVKPEGLTFGPDGLLYVAEYTNARVDRFDVHAQVLVDVFVPAPVGNLKGPIGIVFGPDGRLYVCSYLTNSIEVFDPATGASLGPFVSSADGTPLQGPTWMAFVAP